MCACLRAWGMNGHGSVWSCGSVSLPYNTVWCRTMSSNSIVSGAWTLWTFTGIRRVLLPEAQGFDLGHDLSLLPVSPLILSRWSPMDLNTRQKREMETVGYYLVERRAIDFPREATAESKAVDRLFNGMMTIQIVKPTPTLGYVLQMTLCDAAQNAHFGPSEIRSPMNPGQWPSFQLLDAPLLNKIPPMIDKIETVMAGRNARKKNSIRLFQFALEHHHLVISCLLAVAAMEAILDTSGAEDFERKLCDALGGPRARFPTGILDTCRNRATPWKRSRFICASCGARSSTATICLPRRTRVATTLTSTSYKASSKRSRNRPICSYCANRRSVSQVSCLRDAYEVAAMTTNKRTREMSLRV